MSEVQKFIDVEGLFEQIEFAVLTKSATGNSGPLIEAKATLFLRMAERVAAISQRETMLDSIRELLPAVAVLRDVAQSVGVDKHMPGLQGIVDRAEQAMKEQL